MPKLSDKVRKFVDKQEPDASGGGFAVIREKYVHARLEAVTVEDDDRYGESWNLTFGSLVGDASGTEYPGKQFYRLSIPAGSKPPADYRPYKGGVRNEDATPAECQDAWTKKIEKDGAKLHALFDVAGYTTDSDTDELLGETYLLELAVQKAKSGAREGQEVNRVMGFGKPGSNLAAAGDGAGGGGASAAADEDEF